MSNDPAEFFIIFLGLVIFLVMLLGGITIYDHDVQGQKLDAIQTAIATTPGAGR